MIGMLGAMADLAAANRQRFDQTGRRGGGRFAAGRPGEFGRH